LDSCTKDKVSEIPIPTVYEIQLPEGFPPLPLNNENPLTKEGIALGRRLFYDSILSRNYTMSCASCHNINFGFTDNNKIFSEGINGIPGVRNSMPLYNLAYYDAFFWDGRASSIEAQALQPVPAHNEMDLAWDIAQERIRQHPEYPRLFMQAFPMQIIDSMLITKAIAQFERTLISGNSKFDKVKRGEAFFTDDELEGYLLMNDFNGGDCLHCHPVESNALITTLNFRNNGLDAATTVDDFEDKGHGLVTGDPNDNGKFKVPSLRNVTLTAPYMHDGRFASLDEVLDFYSTGVKLSPTIDPKMEFAASGGVNLTATEKLQIKAFLATLTDSSFIQNPEFKNPF